MKTKYIILTIICLTIGLNAEAQLLRKIKKRAEAAAEKVILQKTDEVVTETTEGTIDGVTEGNNDEVENKNEENIEVQSNTGVSSTSGGGQVSNTNSMPIGSSKSEKIPESYSFDWVFKTKMISSKKDSIPMDFLINSNSKDYAGMEILIEENKQKGTVVMVMDTKIDATTMFMDVNGQKMAQTNKMPNQKEKNGNDQFTYKEIGTKTILGYKCFGIEVENKGYKATMYYTLDAPVSFSAFFALAKNKAPKGFDPALIEILEEEAFLMEMHGINKKKNDESYTLTAISLDKKDIKIEKSDYQIMNMGF